ncbi:MAG: D-aminoacyl-tRNA deacylase [Candidatus Micrarchaeota archaeon]|nr:D-aminoacyl-tRNA deacylase [Candidatus Micrarchaeota archaeon]
MPCIVYTADDEPSLNIAACLKEAMGFCEDGELEGHRCFSSGKTRMIELAGHLFDAEYLNELLDTDLIIFLSRHASEKGTASFTTHSLGNWSGEAKFGGRAKCLSVSSPETMANVLRALERSNTTEIPVTYEATHHGPLLDTPSLFVELGGNGSVLSDRKLAGIVAKSVSDALAAKAEYSKIAIGIGGTHYPDKFTKLALEGRYAFSHIMSRHYVENVDMIEDAVERSDKRAEIAVIEWKSIKAADRYKVIGKLNDLGIEYERA